MSYIIQKTLQYGFELLDQPLNVSGRPTAVVVCGWPVTRKTIGGRGGSLSSISLRPTLDDSVPILNELFTSNGFFRLVDLTGRVHTPVKTLATRTHENRTVRNVFRRHFFAWPCPPSSLWYPRNRFRRSRLPVHFSSIRPNRRRRIARIGVREH